MVRRNVDDESVANLLIVESWLIDLYYGYTRGEGTGRQYRSFSKEPRSDLPGVGPFTQMPTSCIDLHNSGGRVNASRYRLIYLLFVPIILNACATPPLEEGPPGISITDVANLETDSGTNTFSFTVIYREDEFTDPVYVYWVTTDGTASTADADYEAGSGQLEFLEGNTTQTIDVIVNGDTAAEADEAFTVDLINSSPDVTLADARGLGTIRNDDPPPPVSSIEVSPEYWVMAFSQQVTLLASLLDADGLPIADTSIPVNWTSSNSSIALVTGNGRTATVDGIIPGVAEISAEVSGVSATATIRIVDGSLEGYPEAVAPDCSARLPVLSDFGRFVSSKSMALDMTPADEVYVAFTNVYGNDCQTQSYFGSGQGWKIVDQNGAQLNWNLGTKSACGDCTETRTLWDRGNSGSCGHPVELQFLGGGAPTCTSYFFEVVRRLNWNLTGTNTSSALPVGPASSWCGSVNETPCGGGSGGGSGLECVASDPVCSLNPTWSVYLTPGDQLDIALRLSTDVFGGTLVNLDLLGPAGDHLTHIWENLFVGTWSGRVLHQHTGPAGTYFIQLDNTAADLWEYAIGFAVRQSPDLLFASDETGGQFVESNPDTSGNLIAPQDSFRFLAGLNRTITVHYTPAENNVGFFTVQVTPLNNSPSPVPAQGSFDSSGDFVFTPNATSQNRQNAANQITAISPIAYQVDVHDSEGGLMATRTIAQDLIDRMRQEYIDATIVYGERFTRGSTGLVNGAPPRNQVRVGSSAEIAGSDPRLTDNCRDRPIPNYYDPDTGIGVIWDQGFSAFFYTVETNVGSDICLHSGHRSPSHQRRVNPSVLNSDHQWGRAVDMSYSGLYIISPASASVLLTIYHATLEETLGQVILEENALKLLPLRWDPPLPNHFILNVGGNLNWAVQVVDSNDDGVPDRIGQVLGEIPSASLMEFYGQNLAAQDTDADDLVSPGDVLVLNYSISLGGQQINQHILDDLFARATHVHGEAP